MKRVPLTQGEFAMVDDEDFDLVMRHKWQVKRSPKSDRKYAMATVVVNGKQTTIMMHRLILDYYAPLFDHHDGDGLNNQKSNLRKASNVENGRNRKLQKHSSRFKGVHWNKQTNRWTASIRINKILKHLGYFDSEVDAAIAYDAESEAHFGQFSKNNKQLGIL